MSRVRIAELKARLRAHLRSVRGGRTLSVIDRDTPIARIVPYEAAAPLEVRRATRRARDLSLPPPPAGATDCVAVLLRDIAVIAHAPRSSGSCYTSGERWRS
jgi:antitoxin (DNA-binding transcriptional repressor) of toxin-antitoxin stability system